MIIKFRGWLSLSIPAKPKRKLTKEEMDKIIQYAENYIGYMKDYKSMEHTILNFVRG